MADVKMTSEISGKSNDPNTKRIASIYVVSISVFVITAPFFIWSDFCKQHPGIVLVLAGVVGEGIEIFSKIAWHEQSKKLERVIEFWGAIFWIIVVLGLCWEFREAAKSDEEVARLNKLASDANERAAKAELETAELYARIQPRRMTPEIRQAFIEKLKEFPKGTVAMECIPNDMEAFLFMKQIGDSLAEVGWSVTTNDVMAGTQKGMGVFVLIGSTNHFTSESIIISRSLSDVAHVTNAIARGPFVLEGHTTVWIGAKPLR